MVLLGCGARDAPQDFQTFRRAVPVGWKKCRRTKFHFTLVRQCSTEMVSAEDCIDVGILFIKLIYSKLYQIVVGLRLFTKVSFQLFSKAYALIR